MSSPQAEDVMVEEVHVDNRYGKLRVSGGAPRNAAQLLLAKHNKTKKCFDSADHEINKQVIQNKAPETHTPTNMLNNM